ncbi:MAG: type II 3-dehydroquinate dehydratase, partial [Bacteroidota bacterium]
AIAAIAAPVFEVHISDISTREDFRKMSYVQDVCIGTISGMNLEGYAIAIEKMIEARSKK